MPRALAPEGYFQRSGFSTKLVHLQVFDCRFPAQARNEKAGMSNIVTIESKPATGQSAAPPPSAAPGQGLQVTENAIKRIRIAMAKEGVSPEEGGLRLGVMGGGCSGLSYSIKFDSHPRERDRIYDFDGIRVFVDPKSFLYLHGMTLDYEETLMRQGFNFINPNSTRSCGCGSSFSS
jgi:iron-sulfur cluster assembly protein